MAEAATAPDAAPPALVCEDVYKSFGPLEVLKGVSLTANQGDVKGEDELREALNAAIVQIRSDGTYQKINAKYFDFDVYGD